MELNDTYNGIQVVVSTVETLQGNEIEEYAYSMYNQYGIGKDSMGILILLSTTDRDVRIETGYHMQKYITDSMSGRILDKYGMEYFRTDDFAQGLMLVQNGIINEIKEKVPNDWETVEGNSNQYLSNSNQGLDGLWIIIVIFGAAIIYIIYLLFSKEDVIAFIDNLYMKIRRKNRTKKKSKKELMLEERDKEWKEKIRELKNEYEDTQKNLNNSIIEKNNEIATLEDNYNYLKGKLEKNEEKFRRIKIIHPNIEDEIKKHIEDENRQKALEWDNSIKDNAKLEASKNNVTTFKNIIDSFYNLPNEYKAFVKTDIEEIKQKYNQSVVLKDTSIAEPISALITACCNKFKKGDYSNYTEISEVYKKVNNLTNSQMKIIPDKDLSKFMSLYMSSSEDNKNYMSAKSAEENIRNTLDRIRRPDRDDIYKLKRAKKLYDSLSDKQKVYFSNELYGELIRKLHKAEDDEEEYRRRKRIEEEEASSSVNFHNSYHSSSSISSHTHHSRTWRPLWRRWC